mmetsp:Transcript_33583/g.37521  ORF Transcript_33583/g.37521 Transcript_33583/m.37521 type:complete len:215 (-) Transcript_33583:14-658(-)
MLLLLLLHFWSRWTTSPNLCVHTVHPFHPKKRNNTVTTTTISKKKRRIGMMWTTRMVVRVVLSIPYLKHVTHVRKWLWWRATMTTMTCVSSPKCLPSKTSIMIMRMMIGMMLLLILITTITEIPPIGKGTKLSISVLLLVRHRHRHRHRQRHRHRPYPMQQPPNNNKFDRYKRPSKNSKPPCNQRQQGLHPTRRHPPRHHHHHQHHQQQQQQQH